MKAYITKYALTKGIFEIDAEYAKAVANSTMISQLGTRYPTFYHKPDWHLTPEEAIAHAAQMKLNKISSLMKSIYKMEKLSFTPDKIKKIGEDK